MAHRIGTRASALARAQTAEIIRLWRAREPRLEVRVVELTTAGDDLLEEPLERMEGTGFFSSALERALLSGVIDVAVHSYKDLPVVSAPGLVVAAVPARGPVEDALCARDRATLAELPPGARVGTSSLRRRAQLKARRRDLDVRPLRGNVPTRLQRVARGELEAVVLATAGLERLGLLACATEILPVQWMLAAPAQGALAVQVREDDAPRREALAVLEHRQTRRAVETERTVLHELHGGCSVPVGAYARAEGDSIVVRAGVFSLDGERTAYAEAEGEDPAATGRAAAHRLLAAGAGEILAEPDREPRPLGTHP